MRKAKMRVAGGQMLVAKLVTHEAILNNANVVRVIAITKESNRRQLGQTGDTVFFAADWTLRLGIFLPSIFEHIKYALFAEHMRARQQTRLLVFVMAVQANLTRVEPAGLC